MKLNELNEQKLVMKLISMLEKAGIEVEEGEDENKLIIGKQPYLSGLITVKNNKIFLVVQGQDDDIDIGEMDINTLVKDLRGINTKKWFKENDSNYEGW